MLVLREWETPRSKIDVDSKTKLKKKKTCSIATLSWSFLLPELLSPPQHLQGQMHWRVCELAPSGTPSFLVVTNPFQKKGPQMLY
jgi:hypothetical protein